MTRRSCRSIRIAISLSALTVLNLFPPSAIGQVTEIPTNLANVRFYAQCPPGFDPVAASPQLLERFGFPPKPDPEGAPEAYRGWQRAVTAPQMRIVPILEKTEIYHRPVRLVAPPKIGSSVEAKINSLSASSTNWSGYVAVDPKNPFRNALIYAYYVVPIAQQAFGQCTGSWEYSGQWVGFDGHGSNDVLQAGTEADALCSGGNRTPYYAAWIEWAPNPESIVSNFIVKGGDALLIEVWSASPTSGHAFFVDFTEGESMSLAFDAPAGTSLVGNSAEWVIERPAFGNTLAKLTNYAACPFDFCYALGGSNRSLVYSPGGGASGTIYSLQMLDENGNVISTPNLVGPAALWFSDSGSAY
jgi:hypothetical protein